MRKFILAALLSTIVLMLNAQMISLKQPISYLALGDSYTIGQSVDYNDRFPVQLKNALEERGIVFSGFEIRATTGWTTGNLISSLDNEAVDIQPNLVSLLIGVNNQYRGLDLADYAREFEKLLIQSLTFTQDDTSAVFVVSIPDYAYTSFGGGNTFISDEIDNFNEINRSITESFGITYVNITDISREGLDKPEYVAEDGLHPSGVQYARWVERIMENIQIETVSSPGFKEDLITIYPNPFTDLLHADFVETGHVIEYRISGFDGRVYLRGKVVSGNITMDLNFLEQGAYIFQALDEKGFLFNHKIIKK